MYYEMKLVYLITILSLPKFGRIELVGLSKFRVANFRASWVEPAEIEKIVIDHVWPCKDRAKLVL